MRRLFLAVLLLFVLAACADEGNPAETVETYLQAKVQSDADTIQALLCADLEANLNQEVASFASVSDAEIQDMSCTYDQDAATVACDGEIVATYGAEDTTFPLATYNVVQEDGEWKWCGEAGS